MFSHTVNANCKLIYYNRATVNHSVLRVCVASTLSRNNLLLKETLSSLSEK